MDSKLPVFLVAAVLLVSGCTAQPDSGRTVIDEQAKSPPQQPTQSGSQQPPAGSGEQMQYSGQILAGYSAPLLDFQKADYDKALQTGDLVVLYFYADWCPICRAEVTHLYGAFNELDSDKVTGFRVNFNDGSTDHDEVDLARQFGVAYQHTKVFLKSGQQVLKSTETWDKARYLEEISRSI